MLPGVAGVVDIANANVVALDVPHVFDAVTVMFPAVEPAVTEMPVVP